MSAAPEARSVLIVGADPALRTVVQLHLAAPGVEIAEATGEDEALALLRRRPAHVVVGRLHGGRFDGLSLLEALRRDPDARLRELPVVLVTDADPGSAASRAAELGRARILTAPLTGPRLAHSVRELLGPP